MVLYGVARLIAKYILVYIDIILRAAPLGEVVPGRRAAGGPRGRRHHGVLPGDGTGRLLLPSSRAPRRRALHERAGAAISRGQRRAGG